MSEYLSKEEIKQWRSSLEKITLEEYAARLGKKIEEKKATNDLVDIVLHGKPVISESQEWVTPAERLSSIADRAYEKEKEIFISPFSAKNLKLDTSAEKPKKESNVKNNTTKSAESIKIQKTNDKKSVSKIQKALEKAKKVTATKSKTNDKLRQEVRIVFKKALTDREQKVFDYFVEHKNSIVYAKDLATLLDLPRDYVYKYIKNLRTKIDGEALQNADKGGFILNV